MSNNDTIRLVATTTEAERAHGWAEDQVSWALRNLTANLLRIIRGAGKPHEIVEQSARLTQALVEYQEAVGHWPPSHELSEMLSIDHPGEWRSQSNSSERDFLEATECIVRGALQKAASRLIGQLTQERAGGRELYDGVRDLENARAEMRRERGRERVAAPARQPRKPKNGSTKQR